MGSNSGDSTRQIQKDCKYDWNCTRPDCWFLHPNGRFIDQYGQQPKSDSARGKERFQKRSARERSRSRDFRRASRSSSSPSSCARKRRRHGRRSRRSLSRSASTLTPSRSPSRSPSRWEPQASPELPELLDARTSAPEPTPTLSPDQREVTSKTVKRPSTSAVPMFPMPFCFRQFVLKEISEKCLSEEAIQKYQDHVKFTAEQSLERLKGSGLLFDLYNPSAVQKYHDMKVSMIQQNAEQFIKDLKDDIYSGVRLLADGISSSGTCQVDEQFKAPYFALDANAGALQLTSVPFTVSIEEILKHLQAKPGFHSWRVLKPEGPSLLRSFQARFRTLELSKKAQDELAAERLDGGLPLNFILQNPASVLEAEVMPPCMSEPGCIAKHVDLSAKVVHKLDSLLGIPSDVTASLLERQDQDTETRLDLQILYLHRVHRFDFYGCEWCDNEWDLQSRCSPMRLRANISKDLHAQDDADTKWTETHQQRVEEFLACASFQAPPSTLPADSDDVLQQRLDAAFAGKIRMHTPEKYQCKLCSKFFRGDAFVRKHIGKMHTDLVDATRKQHLQELEVKAKELEVKAFRADSPFQEWLGALEASATGGAGGA